MESQSHRDGSSGAVACRAWRAGTGALSLLILILLTAEGDGGSSPKEYLMPGETCGYIVDNGDQFKVESKQLQAETNGDKTAYPANVSCTIIFRTEPGKRNFLRLSHFEVESSRFCERDGLYLYDGGREDDTKLLSANQHALCGTTLSLPNYFVSISHEVTIKFVTDGRSNSYGGFTMLITPFTETDNCNGFTCKMSQRCITIDASCNNEYQCEDGSDEPPNCHLQNTGFRSSCPWSQWALLFASTCVVAFHWMLTDTRLLP